VERETRIKDGERVLMGERENIEEKYSYFQK
jgi:hypothetical protein